MVDELKSLEQNGALKPFSYLTWNAPIAFWKANFTIRLCADCSTGLNAVSESNCHSLPISDDISIHAIQV